MMKKYFNFALLSAIALTGTMGFTACSSSDDVVDVNLDPGTESGTVPTQFVFNVSTAQAGTTRMSAATAQYNGTNFRGIEKTYLMAYKKSSNGEHIFTPTNADKVFNLATILSSGQITTADSRRVIELSMPTSTNSLMFYGKAIKGSGYHSMEGNIIYNPGKGSDASFELTSRLTTETSAVADGASKFTETQNLIATLLTKIANTALEKEASNQQRDLRYCFYWYESGGVIDIKDHSSNSEADKALKATYFNDSGSGDTYTSGTSTIIIDAKSYTIYFGTLSWQDYASLYAANVANPGTNDLKPLEENLAEILYELTNIKAGEARAGSGTAVERTIGDMWQQINKVRFQTTENAGGAIATSPEEYRAQLLAERINSRLAEFFTGISGTCAFQTTATVKTAMDTYFGTTSSTSYSHVGDGDLRTFPTNVNLPLGSAQLTYNTTNKEFVYTSKPTFNISPDPTSTETPKPDLGVDPAKIMYPAELCYFGNGPIRVSENPKITTDFPATVAEWENDGSSEWNDFTKNGKVTSTTRSVAMQNDINYGTALLKTNVKYSAATLKDGNKLIHPTEEPKEITPSSSLFTLTGILIGGQNNEMGWNYLRRFETADAATAANSAESDPSRRTHSNTFDYVIYDNYVGEGGNGSAVPAYNSENPASTSNYTLVFDNYDSGASELAQNDVLVCLEFKNNGGDFYGKHNLIRTGQTFYLVGKLTAPTETPTSFQWPTATTTTVCHPLPPYNADGTTKQAYRVFIQDYVTEATFSIGETSLQNAFVTVPNLKASQTSLGLNVDITWRTGLTYDVTF